MIARVRQKRILFMKVNRIKGLYVVVCGVGSVEAGFLNSQDKLWLFIFFI